jgi:HD-GYP domain-containing protein (c-di-GMP phosphodiesterase class II)/DNA-binding CsgD family transcriptional regulator
MAHAWYPRGVTRKDVRLAELLGALSLACDVAFGLPVEKAMRSCVLAVELGRRRGLTGQELRDVYYTALLDYLGCTAFGVEAGRFACADDIGMNRTMANMLSDPSGARIPRMLGRLGAGAPLLQRARGVTRFFMDGEVIDKHGHATCDVTVHLARMVGMSRPVCDALSQVCEMWDGHGGPNKVGGEALHLPIRISHIACFGEVAHHRDGRGAAIALVKKQSGKHYDPALAKLFLRDSGELLAAIEGGSIWERFLAAEPEPHVRAGEARIDDVATAFAELADLKSVWTLGHSTGVAALATVAAEALGMSEDEVRLLHRAALLHDLGRVSASNRIWDKPGTLSPSEWESVRMHAYWTERILSQSPLLREAAQLASAAHERLDGAGYHRSVPSPMLGKAARILAAADAYHAMREARPYRPARSAEEAAEALLADVAAGRLDRDAARAILEAAGHAISRTPATWPCGLTDREVEVLRLVARGQSNKEIASSLGISPRTAQHHVIHIYQKIDVSSRAGAALFATENGLLMPN